MASAKKRVEMAMASKAKLQSAPYVQINTHVDDPQKSLEELFTAGVRTHEQRKHYERKKHTIPISFNQRPVSVKSRGSSAGHSREGSSDDGIGSSGRQTLSPSSVSSTHFSGPYQGPVHTRQGSAPALINCGGMEHHSSRQIAAPVHAPSKSLSVMAMTDVGDQQFTSATHRTAKSCDLDSEPNRHLEMSFTPDGQPFYIDHNSKMTYWSDPRAKSQSLDPLAVGMNDPTIMQQPQQQPQQQPIGHSLQPNDLDDGLGPLPEGWMKNYDQNGDPYFIDHINQTTTWYDPRIPRHLQEERIRQRHACGRQDNDQTRTNLYESPQDCSSSLVQQLQMERRDMQQRQQQLCREGLIDPQWQNAQQYQQAPISPMQHSQIPQAYSNYCSPPQPGRPQMMPTNYYAHNRNISNDSAVDNTMEVDYITSAHMGMAPLQGTHHIDPNLVRDLTAQDLNPRDFDQYLQLNDNRSPAIAKQYM
uniref:Yorkie n=1 Tax=Ascaris suum TaxID=6253 RepID=F1L212_ASCSU